MGTHDNPPRPSILPLSGKDMPGSPAEVATVGQPPDNEGPRPEIPVGIEALLSLAAASPEFAEALVARRQEAAAASGVQLTPSERRVLGAVGGDALGGMIAGVGSTMPDHQRRQFLGRSASVLAALAGGVIATGAAGCPVSRGSRPDQPEDPKPTPPPPGHTAVETGSRPDRPEPHEITATGSRPDPPPDLSTACDPGVAPSGYGSPRTGSRPDRPDAGKKKKPSRPASRGHRPDRPRTRGISPDRPDRKADRERLQKLLGTFGEDDPGL